MRHPNLFDQLDASGRLRLPGADAAFGDLPWNPHPDFEGVELKHLITKRETGGLPSGARRPGQSHWNPRPPHPDGASRSRRRKRRLPERRRPARL